MTKTSLAAAMALAYSFPTAAFAQPAPLATATAASGPNTATAAVDDTAVPAIQTVVIKAAREGYVPANAISATRTNTPLIDTPQSVAVLPRTLLDDQDVRTLSDALVNVSGVVPTRPEEVLLIAPIIRGFPAETYLDGLPIFGGNQQAFNPSGLVGVERIEVLKGPSSSLYGGGLGSPLGGLINVESARPEIGRTGGFLALRAGGFSTVDPYGDFNVSLNDRVAIRLAGEYQRNDSWIDKVHGERLFLQPSVLFEIDPQTDLFVSGQINRTHQLEYSGLPAQQALAGELDRNAFPGAPNGQPLTNIDNQLGTLELRHAFAGGLRLDASARYYDSTVGEYGSFVFPAMAASDLATETTYPIFPLTMRTGTREAALDANLSAPLEALGGHHKWLVGVSFDHTHFLSGMGFNGNSVGSLDLSDPVYNLEFGARTPINLTQTDRYRTIAAYVQDQAAYGALHVTGSLRLTKLGFQELEEATDQTYRHLSPRIGATYEVSPGVSLYAGYATAFRAAFGYVGSSTPKPEDSRNVEAGLKFAVKTVGLLGTVAMFDQRRDNVATPDPADPLLSIQTGRQRARGFETDLTWEPVKALSVLANYAYSDATVTEDNVLPVGDKLPRVPRNSGRVAARYRVLDGDAQAFSFGGGVTVVGRRELTLPNTVSVPGMATVDAQAAYDFGRYTIEVSGVNLTGRRAYNAYQYFGFPVVMPTQPQSVYVSLKVRL